MEKRYLKNQYGGYVGGVDREVIESGQEGNPIRINNLGKNPATVTILPGQGTGKAQFTTSPDSMIDNDTAVWMDWPLGEVEENTSDSLLSAVTAVRGVSITGQIIIEVVQ